MSTPLSMLSEEEFVPAARSRSGRRALDRDAGDGGRGRRPVLAQVKGRVDGRPAQVTVRQRFINTFDVPLEVTYIFPCPTAPR